MPAFRHLAACALAAVCAIHPSAAAAEHAAPQGSPWWKHAVVYEIYVRSFQDSGGDGIGDINGITQRLDYLKDLGVDALWISPMFPSPQIDFGYDISNYEDVDPKYGTLADFDRLIAQAKQRHIRIVIDMVLNHTSDKHPWFVDSAGSRNSAKHDWYIWNQGKRTADGSIVAPNNWVSLFGGSAWEWVPSVREFYYHKFYKQQPDLNWRNPAVESAMFSSMRFWMDRGVAGFRLDAVPTLFEDPELRDERLLPGTNAQGDPNLDNHFTENLPELHATMRRLRAMVETYAGDRVLIGETYLPNTVDLDAWYGGARHDELHLPMDMLIGFANKLSAPLFRKLLSEVYTQIHGSQPLLVFDNHDNIRSWDRYGDGVHDKDIAKLIATLLMTSKATALLYQGEEIGQRTTTPTRVEDVRDPIGVTGWPKEKGRDGERTPMQWDASNAQAGFSRGGGSWLPVPANYKTVNVASQLADPTSLLNWHRQLIRLRRTSAGLRDGAVAMLDANNPNVLSYLRLAPNGHAVVVALNMSSSSQTISLDVARAGAHGSTVGTLLVSPDGAKTFVSTRNVTLQPFGSWVASVE